MNILDDYREWADENLQQYVSTHSDRCHMWPRHEACMIHRLAAALESAERAGRGSWISVEERLPEPDYIGNPIGVLACLPDGEVCIGFCDNDEYGVRWHCQSTQKPTHWMPLPEPPEVK